MSKNSNDNQKTPTEPQQPEDQNQGSRGNPDQEPEQEPEQLGKLSPNTAINPKIKNL